MDGPWTVGPEGRTCNCRLHVPDAYPGDALDDRDRLLLANVEEYGWHIVQIAESDASPGWVFSVGMWHTLGSPEVAIFGLDRSDAARTINRIGDAIRAGVRLGPDTVLRNVLDDGWPMGFRPIDDTWYRPLFGYAIWFGQYGPMPIAQGVWADPGGHFPWDAGFDPDYAADQPSLWIPADRHPPSHWSRELTRPPWSFPVGHHVAAYTTRRVVAGAPIVQVFHDRDGDWQFFDAADVADGDGALEGIGHLVSRDPTLMDLGDLPQGWQAWRSAKGEPWSRAPMR